jgi:hypothetical protein
LSQSGELISSIACFSGRVSVFRSGSDGELHGYQRALAGLSGPDKILINIDDEEYLAEEQNLIGFGETFLDLTTSPAVYLLESGVPDSVLDSTIISFGLERVAHIPCSQLTRCEERRLRIIAATYSRDRALIINDPFQPVGTEWRERLAELIAGYAHNQNQIVVVPGLSYRPQHWVDCDYVDRIIVGENRQKTIGFGSGPRRATGILNQVRDLIKSESAMEELQELSRTQRAMAQPLVESGTGPDLVGAPHSGRGIPQAIERMRLSPQKLGAAFCLGALVLALVVRGGGERTSQSVAAAKIDSPAIQSQEPSGGPEAEQIVNTRPESVPETVTPAPIPDPPGDSATMVLARANIVLDSYPSDVKNSIIATFEGISSADNEEKGERASLAALLQRRNLADSIAQKGDQNNQEADDLLLALQNASNEGGEQSSGPGENSLAPPQVPSSPAQSFGNPDSRFNNPNLPVFDPMAEQQKRELIRQKFLEAIDRAAQQQQAQ